MKSIMNHSSAPAARFGVVFVLLLGLASCSTIKSISPFTSGVPYAQDVVPTVSRPASPEVPVYKRAASPPESAPVEKASNQAPAASPPPAPTKPEPKPAPSATQAPPPPPAATQEGGASPPASPAASVPAAKVPQAGAPAVSPPQTNSSTGTDDGAVAPKSGHGKGSDNPPSIPADQMAFHDDGHYRNLAEVPKRPKDLPSFAEARATEASLIADRTGKTPPAEAGKPANATASTSKTDRAPCQRAGSGKPEVTLRFDPKSATLPDDQKGVLSDSLAEIRGGTGAIRVVGHGDTEAGSAQGMARFDLAIGRATAVAQALVGFGIPAQRIAVQVACDENPAAGASVQLYTAS